MPNAGSRDTTPGAVLVLDFDGTVCLGDGPVWAYAQPILDRLDDDLARQITDGLLGYLENRPDAGAFADGYDAIAQLAGPYVTTENLGAAYDHSRTLLAGGGLDIHPPAGLGVLLDRLRPTVRVVLMTNAPATGLTEALAGLGLTAVIDEIIASAGKPSGSAAILRRLLGGADPRTLMSVGDLWRNDIAPALELGATTGFIDRSGRDPRPAHVRGATMPELYPAIEAWARSPLDFADASAPALAPVLSDC